jgi:protein-disulfide isomerase
MRRVPFLLLAGLAALAAVPARPNPRAIGSPNAPITIELFSDFECPACRTLHELILPRLLRDFIVPGKVYLIHREFPLPQHRYAHLAAAYACAAARIGKYEEVSDRLFRGQNVWVTSGRVDEVACRGLTPAQASSIRALVKNPSIEAEIQHDFKLGQQVDIRQTPTMFIRRGSSVYPIGGAVDYELLRRFLDDQLGR